LKISKGNQKPYVEEGQTTQWTKEKGQTMIYKTLHRKLKSEQHEHQTYSTTDNQVIVATVNFRIDDFNLTLGSVDSLLAATLYPGNPDWNRKLWNIVSTERYILHMQLLLECCYT
jgi:hypothetical protein